MIKNALTYLLLFSCAMLHAQKYTLLPDTIALCEGDTASIEIRQEFSAQALIRWTTPQGVINNTRRIRASQPGKYYIRIANTQSSTPLSDSSYLRIYNKPRPVLMDTVLCRSGVLHLDAGNPGMRYQWIHGETTQRLRVISPGRYTVRISNGKCWITDTSMVRLEPPSIPLVQPEVTFCLAEESKVISGRVSPGARMSWNTGATTPSISVTREGTYWLRLESRTCGTFTDSVKVKFKACDCEMLIPNSFTPNEDNRNDYFFPVLQCEYTYFNMSISDRWGNTVCIINSVNGKWDGRFKGNLCPEDIYLYQIESTEKGSDRKRVRNGQIALFR